MKLKEIEQTKYYISKIIKKERDHIKGRSRSSRTADMELYVKIVNSCQLTGSKSTLCGNYSMLHILIIINYYLNKTRKKYFKYIEKAWNIQSFSNT